MAISTQTQNLNLIPGKSAPVVVHLSQGNVGNTVQFYLYDGDDPYYPTNVSIAVHGVRADSTVFGPYTVSVTSGSNLVSFEITSPMTSVNGAAIGELVITDSNQNQIGSANFGMLIEETPYSSSVTYEDDLSIYQRILAYVKSFPAELQSQITSEASTRSTAVSNLQSQISSEASTRSGAVSNLQSQINQIVAPSGQAPSAAEVQNARIGINNVTYSTLGEAIRTQNSFLKERSDTSFNAMTYAFDSVTEEFSKTDYKAIDTSGNVVNASYGTNKVTDKIKILRDILVISGSFDKSSNRLSVAFYSSSDVFISGINIANLLNNTSVSNYYVKAPIGAAYFRVAEVYSPGTTGFDNPLTVLTLKPENKLSDYGVGTPSANLFDSSKVIHGKFKDATAGNTPSEYENSAFSYIEIELKECGTYTISGTSYYALVLGSDGKVIRRLGSSTVDMGNLNINWVYGDKTLVINYRPAVYPTSTYMVVKGSSIPSKYQKFEHYQFNESAKNAISDMISEGTKVYHLGSNREYTSFSAFCRDHASDTSEKTLYIDQGTYNIFEDIGGASFCASIPTNAVWRDVSVVLPPNTHLVGIGKVVFDFNPTTSEIGNGLNLLSPLNVVHAATIENITINASNCRYGIHDEEDIGMVDDKIQRRVYKNVTVNKSGAGFPQAFGAGVSNYTDYLFDHCMFKSTLDCFSYHSAGGEGKNKAHFVINNCVFIGGNNEYAVRFGNATYLPQEIPVSMSNCYVSGKMKIGLETNYGLQNFNLTMTNCNKGVSDIEIELKDGDSNSYPPTVYQW